MMVSMDLNSSPVPEKDEESFERHSKVYSAPGELIETGVSIARRERDERKRRLKRDRSIERPMLQYQPPERDPFYPTKNLKSDRSRLPPGWLDCPSFGKEICFMIPSKVPLGESFNDCITPGKRYSFKQVIHQQRVLGRKLGLVIDLSNSFRYYATSDLNKEGIKHVKIPCKGRDSVPDNKSVNMFVYEVIQFLSRQKQHTKKYILVHCTHGHNRTGYMIIHFLMRGHCSSVTEAVKLFCDARPPGIYKPDYIDALYAYYHERKLEAVVCPPMPEWKRSSDLDLNGDAVLDDDDDGGSTAPVHETMDNALVMTNDDILGDEIPFDQERDLKQLCIQMLNMKWERKTLPFPGSHPVSLNRDNLDMLRQHYYYATWKADGTRYMMLITTDGCYLLDRSFKIRRVQMRFPCRSPIAGLFEKTHNCTLLDGEMIIDTLPYSQKQERRYLIYDIMAVNHVSIIEHENLNTSNRQHSRKDALSCCPLCIKTSASSNIMKVLCSYDFKNKARILWNNGVKSVHLSMLSVKGLK